MNLHPRHSGWRRVAVAALAAGWLASPGCSGSTARLSAEMTKRLESEGINRRADDQRFRYSRATGTRSGGWQDLTASILVTSHTILIHRNDQKLLEITPDAAGVWRVRRDHDRLSIHSGGGRSGQSWSFHPPDDPPGWAEDMRRALRARAAEAADSE